MNPARITVGTEETITRKVDFTGLALFHHVIVPQRPARVVTIVREPIARNLSAYFHRPRKEPSVKGFTEGYAQQIPLEWFDVQFRPSLGVDVYEHPFDHEKGWTVIDHPHWPILILRVEAPDHVKSYALTEFTGVRVDSVAHVNEGADKAYADTYRRFKDDVVLPTDFVDRMLESKYAPLLHRRRAQENPSPLDDGRVCKHLNC